MTTRRDFVKLAGAGALATTLSFNSSDAKPVLAKPRSYNLAIAGYTFLNYKDNIDKAIELMKAVNVKYVSLKDFYLPYNSSQTQIDEVMNKFKNAGLEVYGLGVIYLKTQQDVDNAFSYAKMTGVKIIVISPAYDLLSAVEKKVKEYQIKVAIHNHGPEDKLFPDIDTIYEKVKNMDPMVGICLDIGHSFRCGHEPADMLLKFKDRVFDMHWKDVNEPVAAGKTVISGRGKMNFVKLVKALDKSGYSGMCSLEYEVKDDPALGIAESVGHFNGVLSSIG